MYMTVYLNKATDGKVDPALEEILAYWVWEIKEFKK